MKTGRSFPKFNGKMKIVLLVSQCTSLSWKVSVANSAIWIANVFKELPNLKYHWNEVREVRKFLANFFLIVGNTDLV